MNRIKWIALLVFALAAAQGRAQGFQGGPGKGPPPPPPRPAPQIDPEVFRRIEIPKFDPGPFSRNFGEYQSSKPHKWVWPEWVCWQSALGLFALSLVIGLLYGRFGPVD